MAAHRLLHHLFKGTASLRRQRGRTLRAFAETVGLVYFGNVDQHDDDVDVIRGFTTSLTHHDRHYAVGTYNGYNVRLVDRSDAVTTPGKKRKTQTWLILEIELETHGIPHMAFVPTGAAAENYAKLYTANPTLSPLNSMLATNHSPEYYGRYQILAATTHARRIDAMFPSPVMVAMGVKLWPNGIEIARHKLNIYITERRPSKATLETTLASALWLAETIDSNTVKSTSLY